MPDTDTERITRLEAQFAASSDTIKRLEGDLKETSQTARALSARAIALGIVAGILGLSTAGLFFWQLSVSKDLRDFDAHAKEATAVLDRHRDSLVTRFRAATVSTIGDGSKGCVTVETLRTCWGSATVLSSTDGDFPVLSDVRFAQVFAAPPTIVVSLRDSTGSPALGYGPATYVPRSDGFQIKGVEIQGRRYVRTVTIAYFASGTAH